MSPSERVSSYLTFSPLALRPVLFCGTFYRVPPVFVSKAWRSALSGLSSSTKVPAVERATAAKLHPVEGGLGSFENLLANHQVAFGDGHHITIKQAYILAFITFGEKG